MERVRLDENGKKTSKGFTENWDFTERPSKCLDKMFVKHNAGCPDANNPVQ